MSCSCHSLKVSLNLPINLSVTLPWSQDIFINPFEDVVRDGKVILKVCFSAVY